MEQTRHTAVVSFFFCDSVRGGEGGVLFLPRGGLQIVKKHSQSMPGFFLSMFRLFLGGGFLAETFYEQMIYFIGGRYEYAICSLHLPRTTRMYIFSSILHISQVLLIVQGMPGRCYDVMRWGEGTT